MSKRKPVNYQTLIKIFEADGFQKVGKRGSHHVLVKSGIPRPVIIPEYDEIGLDIIMSCCRTAGMSRAQYLRRLKNIK